MTEKKTPKKALAFIFVTVLIDVIGFGVVIPVMPELVMEVTGEGLSSAARYGGFLAFVYAFMQFFFAPIVGNLSDRFGRRPVLLVSLATLGIDYVIMGLAPTLGWLVLGRFLAGISGASFATANAYIADVSAPSERAQNFGLVGAAFGLGFVLGPVLGGILGEVGSRVPFFAAAALAAANTLYGLLVLPESLPKEKRRPFSIKRANPLGTLGQMRRYPIVVTLLGALFLYQMAHDALPSTWTYYTMLKFEWTERDVGYSLGFVGILFAVVQGGLIRKIMPKVGERRAVYLGFLLMAVGFVGYGLSPRGWVLYAFSVPFALGGLANPALRGIMSNEVASDAQGELQGAITSLQSLTAIMAPVIMTQLFAYFTAEHAPLYLPGAPFITASVLVGCAVVICWRTLARTGRSSAA